MTAPIPEEQDQPPTPATTPPGEHEGELPDEHAGDGGAAGDAEQYENAETSLDEPSDDSGGQ